jgi:hypothetical protein
MDLLSALCRIQSTARHAVTGRFDSSVALEGASRFALGNCVKYLRHWSFVIVRDETPSPELDEGDLALNDYVLQSMLVFVVAHEIAHALLKHNHDMKAWALPRHKWIDRIENPYWKSEIGADLVGAEILIIWCANTIASGSIKDDQWATYWLYCSMLGPIFFFDCERLIATCANEEASSITHPPAVMRQAFVMDYLNARIGPAMLQPTRPNRQFARRVRRRLEEWQEAGTLMSQVELLGGSADDFVRFLIDVAQTDEFAAHWKELKNGGSEKADPTSG